MVQPRKVIYVDFIEKKRSQPFAIGGGPKVTVLAFFLALCALIVATATLVPGQLATAYFAPAVILIAVLIALGVKRAIIRVHLGHLRRSMESSARKTENRTLH